MIAGCLTPRSTHTVIRSSAKSKHSFSVPFYAVPMREDHFSIWNPARDKTSPRRDQPRDQEGGGWHVRAAALAARLASPRLAPFIGVYRTGKRSMQRPAKNYLANETPPLRFPSPVFDCLVGRQACYVLQSPKESDCDNATCAKDVLISMLRQSSW